MNMALCFSEVTKVLHLFENSFARSGEYDARMNCILGFIHIARAGNIWDTNRLFHVLGGIVIIRFLFFQIRTCSNASQIFSWNGFTLKLHNGSTIRCAYDRRLLWHCSLRLCSCSSVNHWTCCVACAGLGVLTI